jgi:hypothetical protein
VSSRMKTLVVAIAGWLIVGILAGVPAAKATTATTVTVTSTPNPATSGDTVTFTAVVTAADDSIPTGSVKFKSEYYDVDATRSLDSTGQATYSTAMWHGPRTITASYSGDSTHSPASASLTQTVLSKTTTTLSSTRNPSTLGQEVTFIANVSGDSPAGSVTFTDGSQTLAVVPVVDDQATYTTTSLAAGAHPITASYGGDESNAPSSKSLTQTVLSSGGLNVTSSLNPAVAGQTVTWRATVTGVPGRAAPTGAVTFKPDYGSSVTRSLDGTGAASYSTELYATGTHNVTVTYSGDGNYAAATKLLSQTILAATTVTLSSDRSTTDPGHQVTFTAWVSGNSPSGSITFADGPQTLDVVPLTNSQATFSTTTLSAGNHVISASYSGDHRNGPSSATKAHMVNVPTGGGYWMLGTGGEVFAFGGAADLGGTDIDAADIEPTPSGKGYWILGLDGSVAVKGDATYFGSTWVEYDDEFAASLSATPDGRGYWIFTSAGRAIPFGNAAFYGDMSGTPLNGSILDSVVTKTGQGYWMVGSDGGIFAFGDAKFFGSTGNLRLNQPVMSMVADPDGAGYWLVASDGGIFAFDAPFYGSMGGTRLNKPISAMVGGPAGYLMVGQDGGIFAFGATPFYGSLGARPPANPILAVALKPANT